MDKKSKKKLIKAEEIYLNNLFHHWDPILSGIPPHTPLDEYDCLVHKIISVLHTDANYDSLLKLISDELKNHFGIKVPKRDIVKNTKQIWAWWKKKQSPEGT